MSYEGVNTVGDFDLFLSECLPVGDTCVPEDVIWTSLYGSQTIFLSEDHSERHYVVVIPTSMNKPELRTKTVS